MGEILRYGAYLPQYRAPLGEIQKFFGRPGRPRAKALCTPALDEDALTMAYEASVAALEGGEQPGVVITVSQSPPFGLRKLSATLARTLGLDGATALDVGGHSGSLLDAFAIAGQAMIGHGLGAADVPRVRAIVRRLLGWGVATGVVLGVLLAATSPVIGGVFSSDPAVRAAIAPGVLVLAASQPLGAVVFVLDGVLIGAADGRYLALAGLVNLLVYVPLLWWAAQTPAEAGAPAAVLAIQLAYCVGFYGIRALTLGLRALGTRWMAGS